MGDPKSQLTYCPDTGIFLRNGKQACRSDMTKGYFRVFYNGKYHKAHRLAWLFYYGVYPQQQIDHINGIKSDNRICNLRDVDQTTNLYNQSVAHSHNHTGTLGVSKNKYSYVARIRVGDKLIHLGSYATKEKASQVYQDYKKEISLDRCS